MSPPSSSSSSPHFSFSLQTIGLGYSIAIAFAFLVLLSSLLLSSYLCCRRRRRFQHPPSTPGPTSTIVPRIFFVAEGDNNNNNDDDDVENDSHNGVVGLDRAVINSYPKFQFFKKTDLESGNGNTNGNVNGNGSDNEYICSICLCDYKEGEMLRMMPDCKHYFHLCCLDAWLKLNGSCPVCRNSPLPTPVSTPLAEVMPLSQYPDNRRRSSVISSSS